MYRFSKVCVVKLTRVGGNKFSTVNSEKWIFKKIPKFTK